MAYGLEKEFMRTTISGELSQKSHPKKLGSPLTHPHISTDFSEAQVELITSPFPQAKTALKSLRSLERFCRAHIGPEILWPLSMPPILPDDIPIAWYSCSRSGMEKTIYRRGLVSRYGAPMQTVCGMHVNLSPDILTTQNAFHIIRNFLREGWILSYLYGAAPAADISYFKRRPQKLSLFSSNTFAGEYATSLRMSSYGYLSKIQTQIAISYAGLWPYIRDLEKALTTPKKTYQKRGLHRHGEPIQLNDSLLQIENEHYSRIRPKAIAKNDETPRAALQRQGVQYLEVRSLDLNPFAPEGITEEQIAFIDHFLLYCLKQKSPPLQKQEIHQIWLNQQNVALFGRKPHLKLKKGHKSITLQDWAQIILSKMDIPWTPPEKTLSAQVLEQMGNLSHIEFGLQKTQHHKKSTKALEQQAANSWITLRELEKKESVLLKGYEKLELSTQLVIREAIARNICVDILDIKGNIIRLRKGKRKEILKQATLTRLDSVNTYFLQGNKTATLYLLKEAGLPIPEGYTFCSKKEALARYDDIKHLPLVVKPNTTNCALGLCYVPPHHVSLYQAAIAHAFHYDTEILVEKECPGQEHRFLIIGSKVIAVARRIPANITGDGESTIAMLIKKKNLQAKQYLPAKEHIHLHATENAHLEAQHLTSRSIPKKGSTVYLRSNSNISTGGDAIDVTDTVHTSYVTLAKKAASTLNVTICGVDMLIPKPKKPGPATILELNYNPHLALHAWPKRGKPRPVAAALLNALGF